MPQETTPPETTPHERASVPSRRQAVVLAVVGAALLAVGIGVGVALPGGGGGAEPDATSTAGPSASPGPTAGTSPSAVPTTVAGVAAACTRAGESAQEALDAIDEAGDAVADLDADRLDQIIDGLQPLRAALPGDVAACRAAVPAAP